jgi:hypothetical protein
MLFDHFRGGRNFFLQSGVTFIIHKCSRLLILNRSIKYYGREYLNVTSVNASRANSCNFATNPLVYVYYDSYFSYISGGN